MNVVNINLRERYKSVLDKSRSDFLSLAEVMVNYFSFALGQKLISSDLDHHDLKQLSKSWISQNHVTLATCYNYITENQALLSELFGRDNIDAVLKAFYEVNLQIINKSQDTQGDGKRADIEDAKKHANMIIERFPVLCQMSLDAYIKNSIKIASELDSSDDKDNNQEQSSRNYFCL
jgi:hypothetical protein